MAVEDDLARFNAFLADEAEQEKQGRRVKRAEQAKEKAAAEVRRLDADDRTRYGSPVGDVPVDREIRVDADTKTVTVWRLEIIRFVTPDGRTFQYRFDDTRPNVFALARIAPPGISVPGVPAAGRVARKTWIHSSTRCLNSTGSMKPSIRIAPKKWPIPLPTLRLGSASCRTNDGANGPKLAPLSTQESMSTIAPKQ